MKIERINENQIRCFISKEDLAARQMKISELAYGTEKAKTLFREMMSFANREYGFSAEDLPLMVEAIPLSKETILLTITKVAFPDELDSRFAYFSDSDAAESLAAYSDNFGLGDSAHSAFDFPKVRDAGDILSVCNDKDDCRNPVRHFIFNSLDVVISASKVISDSYHGENSLYKDKSGKYHLILTIGNHNAEQFNKVCNSLSEYGLMENPENNSYTQITEHGKLISKPHAVSDLSKL